MRRLLWIIVLACGCPASSPTGDQAIRDRVTPTDTGHVWFAEHRPVADFANTERHAVDVANTDQGTPVPGTWVTVSAGTFTMGSPTSEPCRTGAEQQHQVTLTRSFEIQSAEVTQGEFQTRMGYNPAYFSACGTSCPVEMVNWYEAVAYCNALSAQKGLPQCYTCTGTGMLVTCQEATAYSGQKVYTCPGYRLPTEAEWEYAYRAGTQTAYYNGANDPTKCLLSCNPPTDANADAIAWYFCNFGSTTHPAKQRIPNAWGLYDMAGNVQEWCHDWSNNASLGTSTVKDPWGLVSGYTRVIRGGYAADSPSHLRAAARNIAIPTERYHGTGFRCARTMLP